MTLEKGQVGLGLDVGFAWWNKIYDDQGERKGYEDIGLGDTYFYNIPLHVVGGYGLLDFLELNLHLYMMRAVFAREVGTLSAFGLQDIGLEVKGSPVDELSLGLKFLFDLGEEGKDLGDDELALTDTQHAVEFSVAGLKPFGRLGLRGSLNYILTIPSIKEVGGEDVSIDLGDYLECGGGIMYITRRFTAGLDVRYFLTTEPKKDGEKVPGADELTSWGVGLLPRVVVYLNEYLNVWIETAVRGFGVKGLLVPFGEYIPIGLVLKGKNTADGFIPPITVGIEARF